MLKRINDAVSIIDTAALGTPNVVAAYLLTGTETALIDMGYQSSAKIIIDDLANRGIGSDGLNYLLPTHVHLDHSGSCGTLAKRFTAASIRVHPKGEPHLVDPTRLWNGATQLFGEELMRRYGSPEPIERNHLRVANDGEVIDLGRGIILRTVWTPGHASHHLSYQWEGGKAFFTGDAVGLYHPDFPVLIPTTPPTSFDLEKTLRSLERLGEGSPLEFYTPHYGVVANAKQWIGKNVSSVLQWKNSIEEKKKSGLTNEEITKVIIDETSRKIGRQVADLPEYLLVSIKVSTLGVLQYLNR